MRSSNRCRSWRRRTGTALVAASMGAILAACGGGAPTSSPSTTTGPATSASHTTPASVLPTLQKALHEQNSAQYAQAVIDFLTVVKADPANQIAWYDLGVIAHFHGEDAQAIHDYGSALVADPVYVPALYNLAVLEAGGQPKSAAALYTKVVSLQPGNAAARLNLGFVLESLGQHAAAKTQFSAAIRLDPALASRVPKADRSGK